MELFFSSRRRHTIFSRDGSSYVCSSDLWPVVRAKANTELPPVSGERVYVTGGSSVFALARTTGQQLWRADLEPQARSEERRVGKERRSRMSAKQRSKQKAVATV